MTFKVLKHKTKEGVLGFMESYFLSTRKGLQESEIPTLFHTSVTLEFLRKFYWWVETDKEWENYDLVEVELKIV